MDYSSPTAFQLSSTTSCTLASTPPPPVDQLLSTTTIPTTKTSTARSLRHIPSSAM